MIIYAAADIHGKPERLSLVNDTVRKSNPDILVVAGDITNFANAESVIAKINGLPIPVLAVRGNTDLPKVDHLLTMHANTHSLHLKHVSISGVGFAGIGGTIPVPFSSRICFKEKQALAKLKPLASRSSALVFHTPPRWTRDEVMGKFSAGSRNLYEFICKHQPELVICGHIHERAGISSIGKTLVVNCSISRSSSGAIIRYPKNGKPKAEIIKRTG